MKFIVIFSIFFYSFMTLSKCKNLDIERTIDQLIISRGFGVENHQVITKDGYILTMQRIINPYRSDTIKSIIMQHGGMSNAKGWLMNADGKILSNGTYIERDGIDIANCNAGFNGSTEVRTLPFLLSSCGYDVWLSNARGTSYSRGHVSFDKNSHEYWHFSFQEQGIFDLTAQIDYILKLTNKSSLAVVACSTSSSATIVTLLVRPEYGLLMNPVIFTAPVIYPKYLFSEKTEFYTYFAKAIPSFIYRYTSKALQFIGGPIFPELLFDNIIDVLLKLFISIATNLGLNDPKTDPISLINYAVPVIGEVNITYVEVAAAMKDNAPLMTVSNYIQWLTSGEYKFHDLGSKENRIRYGSENAPELFPENIMCKNIALIYGDDDFLVDLKGINEFISRLKVPLLDNYLIPGFRHGDYLLNTNLDKLMHPRILWLLKNSV